MSDGVMKLNQEQVDEVERFVKSGIEVIWDAYPGEWSIPQQELAGCLIRAVKQHLPGEVRHLEEIGELEIKDEQGRETHDISD